MSKKPDQTPAPATKYRHRHRMVPLRAPEDERALWEAAARAAGVTLNDWLRRRANLGVRRLKREARS